MEERMIEITADEYRNLLADSARLHMIADLLDYNEFPDRNVIRIMCGCRIPEEKAEDKA